jgi:hypothetical protein
LRQVALLAEEEQPAADELCATFGLSVAHRDPGLAAYGMRNAVLPVGTGFLEIAAPVDPEVPAARYLRRSGPGGYVVLLQTDDLAAAERRLAPLGVAVARRIERPGATELHLRHRDLGGALLSLDEARPADAWPFAGPDWRNHVRSARVTGLAGVDIACAEPEAVARRWAHVLALPLRVEEAAWVLDLDDGDVQFLPAAPGVADRLAGVRLRPASATEPARAVRLGSTIVRAGAR